MVYRSRRSPKIKRRQLSMRLYAWKMIPDASCLDVYFVKMTWTEDERRVEESHPEKEAEVL